MPSLTLESKKHYPAELEDLEAAFNTMRAIGGHNASILYYTRLRRATEANKRGSAPTVQRLVEHWYDYFNKLENGSLTSPTRKTARKNRILVLEMLSESQHVRNLASTDAGVGLIGYLLLEGSYSLSIGITSNSQELLTNIIDQLSSTPNKTEVVQDVQSCISHIYGPLVWDLYRDETIWDADLPYHFMKLGLSFSCLAKIEATNSSAATLLPTNLA